MIHYRKNEDGSLSVCLSRCNDFGDHKTPEMKNGPCGRLLDGDIVIGTIDKEASLDAVHAMVLIDRMRNRLRHAHAYIRLKNRKKKRRLV